MELTAKQFSQFSQLVYHSCGINLHEGKQQLLQTRLAKRLRQTGINGIDEYFNLLRTNDQELQQFLDVISTNHTFFFRESHHFEYIQKEHANIWCAASSSGEEPYSLAIYCLENGFKPKILATDISTKVLQIGEKGIYPYEKVKNLPVHILKKYFQKGQGKWEMYIRVKHEIKSMVTFKRFNLLTDFFSSELFDAILCRNVLIYFDNVVKTKVINNLYNTLKDNGYLIIGGAESLNNIHHKFKYIRPSIYLKTL